MAFRLLVAVIVTTTLGAWSIRFLEKLGRYWVVFMPVVGLGIGGVVHVALGSSGRWLALLAGTLTYVAAMSTHLPSSYLMFRKELGGGVVQSVFLSVPVSLKYPVVVCRQFGFYCLMLILALIAAAWNAA